MIGLKVRVAIIDEGIEIEKLKYPDRVKKQISYVKEEAGDSLELRGSHATRCARLLEMCAENYELIDIRITRNWRKPVDVRDMAEAFLCCVREEVNIICLSIGTVYLSDSEILNPAMEKLEQHGIKVIASLSNQGYKTLPGVYEQVCCAIMDWNDHLPAGGCAVANHPMLGELMVANIQVFPEERIDWSGNSYASPVVTGWFLRQLEQGKKIDTKNLPVLAEDFEKKSWGKPQHNPVVALISSSAEKDTMQLVDTFSREQQLEAIAVLTYNEKKDLRIFGKSDYEMSTEELLRKIDRYVECSLILSGYQEEEWKEGEFSYDIILSFAETEITICGEEIACEKIQRKKGWDASLCQRLIELLSEEE